MYFTDWAWRIPSLLQVIPSMVCLVFIWGVPESPRWLIAKGREEEAWEILVRYHAEGDRESEYVKTEYAEMVATIQVFIRHQMLPVLLV